MESACEECLCRELALRGIGVERQLPLPVEYKGAGLDCGYRLDLLVEQSVVVEIKSLSSIEPIHEAQLLTYLNWADQMANFNASQDAPALKEGIRRRIL
jgi:GxxExxY protein